MSDPLLKEFAQAAEQHVALPTLAELESRGRDLRRFRRGATAVAASLVLAAGGLVVSLAGGGEDRGAPPAGVPDPSPAAGAQQLDPRVSEDEPLVPGRTYRVRPWTEGEQSLEARFTAPGGRWAWYGDGARQSVRPGVDVVHEIPRTPYAGFGVVLADQVALGQCDPRDPFWGALSASPLDAARQIAEVPGVQVVAEPRLTARFGHPSAHVRLRVPRLCPQFRDVILWRVSGGGLGGGQPGVGVVFYPGQVLDVWVVDVEGTSALVFVEHSPPVPPSFAEQTRAVVESMTLEPSD